MLFEVKTSFYSSPSTSNPSVLLIWDNWDDFSYKVIFGVNYVDKNGESYRIGSVKIGFFGQQSGRSLNQDEVFEKLPDTHFSLGQSDEYYDNLNKLGSAIRDEILTSLRDIAKDSELYEKAINEDVTRISFLRNVGSETIKGQFRRMAAGGVRLTEYNFSFLGTPMKKESAAYELDFAVEPESFPPTNIHVIIGRNGVGKTYLMNDMTSVLVAESDRISENGKFTYYGLGRNQDELFANLISVSFSAFDESEPLPEKKNKTGLRYTYVGLKQIATSKDPDPGPKSTIKLKNEFYKSLDACRASSLLDRWKRGIKLLETDPNFKDANIISLADIENPEDFKGKTFSLFKRLSSGHKIVLLTITRLIENLQEKTWQNFTL